MTQQSAPAEAVAYDPWDQASKTMWHAPIEPDTLPGLWAQPHDSLFINKAKDGYWISEPGVMGEGRYDTLAEAKAAGNAILAKATTDLESNMLRDAGLDAAVWSFEYREGARFTHRDDPSLVIEIEIEREYANERFAALAGGAEVGTYAEVKDAADALVNRPAPGL